MQVCGIHWSFEKEQKNNSCIYFVWCPHTEWTQTLCFDITIFLPHPFTLLNKYSDLTHTCATSNEHSSLKFYSVAILRDIATHKYLTKVSYLHKITANNCPWSGKREVYAESKGENTEPMRLLPLSFSYSLGHILQ